MDKLRRKTMYKTTFYSNVKMLSDLLLFLAIYLFFFFYFKDAIEQNVQIILILTFILLFLLPTCIVHYNYYKFNRGYVYYFEPDFIKRQGVNDILLLNINDIEEIIFFMSPNRIFRSRLINFPFENYFYGKIKNEIRKINNYYMFII